jgi:ribosome-associated protein
LTHSPQENISAFELAVLAANLAESKKATNTLVLDTGKVSYLADYFVVCTGDSPAQIRTIADEIDKAFRKRGQVRIGSEMDKSFKWCLLDYGDVVVHIMHRHEREFYQLEHFWSHANTIDPDKWLNTGLQEAS